MLEKIRVVFTIPELRNKIFLTLGLLAIYRIGFHISLPMMNQDLEPSAGEDATSQFFEKVSFFASVSGAGQA